MSNAVSAAPPESAVEALVAKFAASGVVPKNVSHDPSGEVCFVGYGACFVLGPNLVWYCEAVKEGDPYNVVLDDTLKMHGCYLPANHELYKAVKSALESEA